MIHLCDVSKTVLDGKERARFVLRDVSLSLPRDAQIALIGEDREALTTVLHLLAGSEVPDRGSIIAEGLRRSPIINGGRSSGLLVSKLTGLENINFFARVNGVDSARLLALVESACVLGELLQVPIREYNGSKRRALEISLIAALPYDCYFLDRVDQFERPLVWQLVHAARRRRAGFFFTAQRMPGHSQTGAIVEHGSIRVFHRAQRGD